MKNVLGIIGADMIVVIENNIQTKNTWIYDQEFARLIRKCFSIFSIIRSEILRFPHHPVFPFAVFTVRRNKGSSEATFTLYIFCQAKICLNIFIKKLNYV